MQPPMLALIAGHIETSWPALYRQQDAMKCKCCSGCHDLYAIRGLGVPLMHDTDLILIEACS